MKMSPQMMQVVEFYQKHVCIYFHNVKAEKIAKAYFGEYSIVNPDAVDFDFVLESLTNEIEEIVFATLDVPVGNNGKIVSRRMNVTTEFIPGSDKLCMSSNVYDSDFYLTPVRIAVENIASSILARTPDGGVGGKWKGVGVVYRANLPSECEHCQTTEWIPTEIPVAMTPYVNPGTKAFTCNNPACSHVEYLK